MGADGEHLIELVRKLPVTVVVKIFITSDILVWWIHHMPPS
jgi:hypothetical protein